MNNSSHTSMFHAGTPCHLLYGLIPSLSLASVGSILASSLKVLPHSLVSDLLFVDHLTQPGKEQSMGLSLPPFHTTLQVWPRDLYYTVLRARTSSIQWSNSLPPLASPGRGPDKPLPLQPVHQTLCHAHLHSQPSGKGRCHHLADLTTGHQGTPPQAGGLGGWREGRQRLGSILLSTLCAGYTVLSDVPAGLLG